MPEEELVYPNANYSIRGLDLFDEELASGKINTLKARRKKKERRREMEDLE